MAKDHPRLRRKDSIVSKSVVSFPGAPPLTRERQKVIAQNSKYARITPAHAGKTNTT